MRRLAVCAFVVLAVGLVLAPGALASAGVRHAALGTSHAVSAGPALPALGDGATYNISGHVLDFDGNGVPGAEVDWGWWDGSYNYQPGGTNMPQDDSPGTDNTGAFAFTGVSGGHPQGDDLEITYFPPLSDGLDFIDSWNLDFATHNDATPYSYEMRPGHVNVAIANVPTSMATLVPEVKVGEQDVGFATTEVALTGGAGVAGMLPPSFNDVVAYYVGRLQNCTAQAEWLGLSPVTVAAGATAGDTVNLDWNRRQVRPSGRTDLAALRQARHEGQDGPEGLARESAGRVRRILWRRASYKDYSASVLSTGPGNTYTTSLQIAHERAGRHVRDRHLSRRLPCQLRAALGLLPGLHRQGLGQRHPLRQDRARQRQGMGATARSPFTRGPRRPASRRRSLPRAGRGSAPTTPSRASSRAACCARSARLGMWSSTTATTFRPSPR